MSYGFQRHFFLSYCLACCWLGVKCDLRIVNEWAEMEFVFPNDEAKQIALSKGHYVPGKSVPIDTDVDHGRSSPRIFVTIPRFGGGRPVTFGTVDTMGKILPYPHYSWHENQGQNCDGMTSVYRTAIDECNRLWVMDIGKIGSTQHCTPQLLVFDLRDDRLLYRYRFNQSVYTADSRFVTLVIDVNPGQCDDTYVYLADNGGFGVVVVDVTRERSWRINHRTFYPFPSRGNFTIDGESFDLMDGVLGLALSPWKEDSDRILYYHALASTTENFIRTTVLKNDSFLTNPKADSKDITTFPDERPSQSAAQAMDRDGIMYFGLMEPPSIWCWNSATKYTRSNFHQVAVNRETLQFASGVKIINNGKGEQELWVLTCSFQRQMTGSLNSNRTNFRIHTENVRVILKSSPCSSSSGSE